MLTLALQMNRASIHINNVILYKVWKGRVKIKNERKSQVRQDRMSAISDIAGTIPQFPSPNPLWHRLRINHLHQVLKQHS